ncbi:hypothetical protein Ancab_006204 [Ancistrocladus abbreviatus]
MAAGNGGSDGGGRDGGWSRDDGRRLLRTSLGTLLLVGFTWFLLIGILANKTTAGSAAISLRKLKHVKSIARVENSVHLAPDVVYVSKRRVPNGPDPIHNRHVGESRRQPGRV